ncbi:PREDICTED: THAP domain-containing protein 1-like [Priapulus caudatus]|uniref:THAP domain-containing protein 1-like n=1 Tax=Priapulus caudatus TaxID=37621 RepID=A0ABM1ER26_PRICU|nr:PREDICTED: THAP domain-containing protein 1-like [Priapulus caudatus]
MPSCAAINCTNRQFKGCGRTFHLFPFGRPALLRTWLVNVKRDEWFPSKKAVLCSDHFTGHSFNHSGQTTRLAEDAVPILFDFPDHLKNVQRPRKAPRERCSKQVETSNNSDPGELSPKSSRELVEKDHSYSIEESPIALKRRLYAAGDQINSLKTQLKTTQQKSRRLKKKLSSLQEVVKSLDEKQLILTNGAEMLQKTYTDVPSAIMTRIPSSKKNGTLSRDSYPPVLRAFAVTLPFYSAKA